MARVKDSAKDIARDSAEDIGKLPAKSKSDIASNLSKLFKRQEPSSGAKSSRVSAFSRMNKLRKLQEALGGEIVSSRVGDYLLLKRQHTGAYCHGNFSIRDSLKQTEYDLAHFDRNVTSQALNQRSLLFYDTETTGLGGAGVVAFLIGFGSFTENGFETRQYLLPDFGDELAMLEKANEEFTGQRTLVSYNGKSFDIPLTRDRMIVQRVTREIEFKSHIDLLFSARSLFKRRIQDCSLGNVEEQILGYRREDDIPGYLAPSIYFDWVRDDRTDNLAGIVDHNRRDIVSLALLMSFISEIYQSGGDALSEPLDVYSYLRSLGLRKRHTTAARISRRRILELEQIGNSRIDFERSLILKRGGEIESAVCIWESLEGGNSNQAQLARLELAKWHEHKRKDYQSALALSEKGLQAESRGEAEKSRWEGRLARLRKRLDAT